jgi:choline dehydrogenase-like flavoprotein
LYVVGGNTKVYRAAPGASASRISARRDTPTAWRPLTSYTGGRSTARQCGIARFGASPTTSVRDHLCRTHDVENLYAVDASFLPSSASLNPALTIAAQALRVADKASILD